VALKIGFSGCMLKLMIRLPMSLSTRIWQEEQGKPLFRFQTEDENVHRYLSQRQDVKLVGWGVNFNLWIYLGEFHSLRQAQDTLRPAPSNQ
jgi:hypothetical protein